MAFDPMAFDLGYLLLGTLAGMGGTTLYVLLLAHDRRRAVAKNREDKQLPERP